VRVAELDHCGHTPRHNGTFELIKANVRERRANLPPSDSEEPKRVVISAVGVKRLVYVLASCALCQNELY